MTEAEVLALTYTDTCLIERFEDKKNPETHITEQVWQLVNDEPLKCGFSQKTTGGLPVVEGEMVNATVVEHKLFMIPNVDVKKGDRITITQSTGQTHIMYANKPMFYTSHTEVILTGREING
jgi:hypothetical protein